MADSLLPSTKPHTDTPTHSTHHSDNDLLHPTPTTNFQSNKSLHPESFKNVASTKHVRSERTRNDRSTVDSLFYPTILRAPESIGNQDSVSYKDTKLTVLEPKVEFTQDDQKSPMRSSKKSRKSRHKAAYGSQKSSKKSSKNSVKSMKVTRLDAPVVKQLHQHNQPATNCNCPHQNQNPNQNQAYGHGQVQQKPKGETMKIVKKALKKGLIATVKGVVICCYTCYAVIPPVPSMITKKVAFHPPKERSYFFVINENGKEVMANAKQAYGQKIIRVELLLPQDYISGAFQDVPLPGIRPFVLRTAKNSFLACVYYPCPVANRPKSLTNKVVIFCQPNSSDLHHFLWKHNMHSMISIKDIAERSKADVYAFDYSGFGISSGKTLESNVYADVRAVYEFVRRERPDSEIFLMGFSLGTAVAIDLASTQPANLGGVILMAPFTSGLRVLLNKPYKEKPYPADAFRSYEKAPYIDVPVLIQHGYEDEVIHYQHGISLLRQMQKPVPIELVPKRDHMTIMRPLNHPCFRRIQNFIAFEARQYDELFNRADVLAELPIVYTESGAVGHRHGQAQMANVNEAILEEHSEVEVRS